ncbi:uncharacterized protein [Parasteatoda tepidariorum]|uniref:uncharacterized protein n=1 Tax=Parasteatoda tepidariorum TaxID=114398 RepID=UPI0039BC812B
MPNTCCVTKCNGNYNSQNKVHIFSFPKNEELLKKWVKAIPRTNLIVTKNTKVCERHFQSDDIEFETTFYKESTGETLRAKLKYPRLKDGAVPSIFPNCPKYLSSTNKDRIDPILKKQLLEQQQVNKALADSLKSQCEFEKKYGFKDFFEMKNCFGINNVPAAWRMIEKDENLFFLKLNFKEGVPIIAYTVFINSSLELNISYKNQCLTKCGEAKLPLKVSNFNEVINVLNHLESENVINNSLEENIDVIISALKNCLNLVDDKFKYFIEFFIEQIKLLKVTPVRYRYSPDILIFSSLFYYLSPQAYKFVRHSSNLILPDPSTIRKVSSLLKSTPNFEQQDKYFLMYAKQIFSKLNDEDLKVFLMLDEIYLKPYVDYKGGNIVGNSYDNTEPQLIVTILIVSHKCTCFHDK